MQTLAAAAHDVSSSIKLTRAVLGSNTIIIGGGAAAAAEITNNDGGDSVAPDPFAAEDDTRTVISAAGVGGQPTLNIHSEHLDVELIKYLYKVYFHKKILRNEIAMKRQANQTCSSSSPQDHQQQQHQQRFSKDSGECTPKRTASTLLRVTYFDDFDLFQTAPQQLPHTGVDSSIESKAVEQKSSSKINYNKSCSANDLDACPVPQPQRAPNKAHSLDKPYHRNSSEQQQQQSDERHALLSEAAGIPSGAYGVSTACGSKAATPQHVSTNSSSTELFESSRSYIEPIEEDELKSPLNRSHDSSTASIGLVSCTSKVEDDTVVPEDGDDVDGPSQCDNTTSAVLKSNNNLNQFLGESSDVSCSSVASSGTIRSSLDQQLSDYQSALSPSCCTSPPVERVVGGCNKK